jgi:hypothetical protein
MSWKRRNPNKRLAKRAFIFEGFSLTEEMECIEIQSLCEKPAAAPAQ